MSKRPRENLEKIPEMERESQDQQTSEATPAAERDTAPLSTEELEAVRKKAAQYDELWDSHLRMRADYENARKRLEREMQERANFSIEEFAGELLPVADNLTRAIQAAKQHETVEKILEGVELVEKQLYDALARHGVTPVITEPGQVFDPNVHEAMSVVPAPEQDYNTIVQEIQRGFHIHQRLLRPARVIVSALQSDDEKAGDKNAEGGTQNAE